jgi:hypothetical protein
MQQDQIARAIREAFGALPGTSAPNAAGALNEIAVQLTRIADALERLVEIELLDELGEDEEEGEKENEQ